MAMPGKVVLREGGRRGLLPGGRTAVFNSDSDCPACCACNPRVIATKVTNFFTAPVWDLTPYQGDHVGPPGGFWRLIEVGSCIVYGRGCIDAQGKLVNLPAQFTTHFTYDGYMELQVGCLGDDGYVHFTGPCITQDLRYLYPC